MTGKPALAKGRTQGQLHGNDKGQVTWELRVSVAYFIVSRNKSIATNSLHHVLLPSLATQGLILIFYPPPGTSPPASGLFMID